MLEADSWDDELDNLYNYNGDYPSYGYDDSWDDYLPEDDENDSDSWSY